MYYGFAQISDGAAVADSIAPWAGEDFTSWFDTKGDIDDFVFFQYDDKECSEK